MGLRVVLFHAPNSTKLAAFTLVAEELRDSYQFWTVEGSGCELFDLGWMDGNNPPHPTNCIEKVVLFKPFDDEADKVESVSTTGEKQQRFIYESNTLSAQVLLLSVILPWPHLRWARTLC